MTIPLHKVFMAPEVDGELSKVLHSGFIGQGQKVDEFEKALIPWTGRETNLAVNSCTSAITLALRLSGVGPGDEVISTPMTCTATNEPILLAGAKIVWADVNATTGMIDPTSVRDRITSKTKAIICVHLGGTPCDLEALLEICRDSRIKLIEDAAHAFGAVYNGQPIGSHADFVCFSFQAIKHLTTGDGGLLTCKDPVDYERGKLLRWYGIKRPADLTKDIPEWGYKFHMNDINAAIGLANLPHMQKNLEVARENAEHMQKDLFGTLKASWPAYWFFPMQTADPVTFRFYLQDAGIAAGPVHIRNDHYSMFQASARPDLFGLDVFSQYQINLPCGWWVKEAERLHIIDACKTYLRDPVSC